MSQKNDFEHPLGAWIEVRFPGVKLRSTYCIQGIFLDGLEVEQQAAGLGSITWRVMEEVKRYARWSGETILGGVSPAGQSPISRERLIRLYIRCGGAWDEDRGLVVYPPERAGKVHEILARGLEKYEGIL